MEIETNQVKLIPPSGSVAWWPVLLFVADRLGVEPTAVPELSRQLPLLGTPSWCALADDDPVKLAAVLDGGCRHALRVELGQEARADASKAVADAVDWRAVANELSALTAWRADRPWARKQAS